MYMLMLCFVLTFLFNSFIIIFFLFFLYLWKFSSLEDPTFFTIIFDETRDFLEILVETNIINQKTAKHKTRH